MHHTVLSEIFFQPVWGFVISVMFRRGVVEGDSTRVACVTYNGGKRFLVAHFAHPCEGSSAENSPDGNTTNHQTKQVASFPN